MTYHNREAFKRFYDNNITTNFLLRKIYEDKNIVMESLSRMDAIYVPALNGMQRFGYGSEREVLQSAIDFGIYVGLTYAANEAMNGFFIGVQEKARAVATANSNHSKALKSARPTEPPQE